MKQILSKMVQKCILRKSFSGLFSIFTKMCLPSYDRSIKSGHITYSLYFISVKFPIEKRAQNWEPSGPCTKRPLYQAAPVMFLTDIVESLFRLSPEAAQFLSYKERKLKDQGLGKNIPTQTNEVSLSTKSSQTTVSN